MQEAYVLGVDFGTDSVRTLVVDARNGQELGSAVHYYRRWAQGKYCVPAENQFRQHPLDYVEGLEESITGALKKSPAKCRGLIKGISIDTTGSTPCAVDKTGTPLALTKKFAEDPNAMFVLWKDHTSVREAAEVNKVARTWGGEDYTKYEGGIYSSEWFWAKILHVLRESKAVRSAAHSWVEHCDWIPALLTGVKDAGNIRRGRCAAGHKAMWHPDWGGLPPEKFLVKLDPLLAGLRGRLYQDTYTAETVAGVLSPEWAKRLGLPADVKVGVGAFDVHIGVVGGGIQPNQLGKVMGTSTCDIVISPKKEFGKRLVRGICGQVDGSVTSNMIGLEAGQSAVGDIYAWFQRLLMFAAEVAAESKSVPGAARAGVKKDAASALIPELEKKALKLPIQESGVVSLDWMNGRRTPDANQMLKGVIAGLNLGSDAPRVYRSLIEATAFGAKAIVDRFQQEGVKIESVLAMGGVAKKSPLVMQIHSDVFNMPVKVVKSDQACALGAAIFAATCSGLYPDIRAAQKAMQSPTEKEYRPIKSNVREYQRLYQRYLKLAKLVEGQFTEAA
jgi:L-ribulokinase